MHLTSVRTPLLHSSLFILECLFLMAASQADKKPVEKWIIDTDAGADDAIAIFSFLSMEQSRKDIKLMAITTSHGNTDLNYVNRNVLKILATVDRLDIPVYKGMNESLLVTPGSDHFFGKDGFGEIEFPDAPSDDLLQKTHAVNFLINAVNSHPDEINIIVIAPLTNVAMATRLDPTFLSKVKNLYIFGGSIQGKGNVRPGVEFNFFTDPEAAYIVLDEAKKIQKILHLYSWETGMSAGISKDWRKDVFAKIPTKVIDLINKAERKAVPKENPWITADTNVLLWAIDPNYPVKTLNVFGKIETSGIFSRGVLLLDYMERTGEFKQLSLALPDSVDPSYIQEKFMEIFTNFGPPL